MNYWKQFAELLGLELGQEFSLIKSNGEKLDEYTYKITKNGLYYKAKNGSWCVDAQVTYYVLNGKYEVVHKPWKPKEGERYWFYSKAFNQTISRTWVGGNYELCLWKVGNCFKTEKEAETKGKEIMEQIQKELDEA